MKADDLMTLVDELNMHNHVIGYLESNARGNQDAAVYTMLRRDTEKMISMAETLLSGKSLPCSPDMAEVAA